MHEHHHRTHGPGPFDAAIERRHEALGDAFIAACIDAGIDSCMVMWITEHLGAQPRALLFVGVGQPEAVNAPTDEALVAACVRRLAHFRRSICEN